MPPAVPPAAIAPPLRRADALPPDPTPLAAADFLALVAASLSSGRSDGGMSAQPPGEQPPLDGERDEVATSATDGRSLPAPSDLPPDAAPPDPAVDEVALRELPTATADAPADAPREVAASLAPTADVHPFSAPGEASAPGSPPPPESDADAAAAARPDPAPSPTIEQADHGATEAARTGPELPRDGRGPLDPEVADPTGNRGAVHDATRPPGTRAGSESEAAETGARTAAATASASGLSRGDAASPPLGNGAQDAADAASPRPTGKRAVDLSRRGGTAAPDRPAAPETPVPQPADATDPEARPTGSRPASAPAPHDGQYEVLPDDGVPGRPPLTIAEARSDTPARPSAEGSTLSAPSASTSPDPSAATEPASPAVPVRSVADRAFVPPARQLAPVLITLALSPQDGPARLTLSLEPEELGRIEVAVERVAEGRLAITVVAERAETLHLLQRDSALLDRALAQAGVGSEGRSLAFAFGEPGGGAHGDRGRERGPARASPEQASPRSRPAGTATALLDIAV